MSIHFKANLRPVVKDRTGILYWVMNPLGSGVIIAHDLSENLVMLHNFDVGRLGVVWSMLTAGQSTTHHVVHTGKVRRDRTSCDRRRYAF